ncbi:monovalent cation/H(+) antiporter subunit G, partial [Rhizobium ruizarguesonis]
MIDYILAAITALLLIVGALFALAAAIGLVMLPDLYTRMHSASKAGISARPRMTSAVEDATAMMAAG